LVALPAEFIAGSRRVSRRSNRSTKWILYGGKSADSAGGIDRRREVHETAHYRPDDNSTLPFQRLLQEHECTAKVLVFWQAPDEASAQGDVDPAVFTLIETLIVCRAGLQTGDNVYIDRKLAVMPSYGIFKCNHEIMPANKASTINSVDENLQSKESYQFKDRTSRHNRMGRTEDEQETAKTLYEATREAVNPDDTACPIEGCGYVFSLVGTSKSRRFNVRTKQWVCPPCLYFAETDNGIPPPVTKPKTSHDPTKVDLVCDVSWCTTLMQNDQGLIRRMWHAGLRALGLLKVL